MWMEATCVWVAQYQRLWARMERAIDNALMAAAAPVPQTRTPAPPAALAANRRRWHVAPPCFARDVLLPFVLTRLALSTVGAWAAGGDLQAAWAGWDAGWYMSIARHGYGFSVADQSNTAFAPLLPLLMHLGGLVLGAPDSQPLLMTSGIVASNLALLIALGYLVALVRLDFDPAIARRAALYALVFPSTLFLSAVYPHALFLAAAIASFYYARLGRWWLAGLLGGVAGLTRLQGSLIVLPLAYEYLAACRFDLRRLKPEALGLLLAPLGTLAFAALLWLQVGDPLAMLSAGGAWGRHPSLPWEPLLAFASQPIGAHGSVRSPLDLAFTLLLIGLVGLSWARVPRSLALFATLFLLVTLSSGLLVSSMRYGLELFPIFITLAVSGRFRVFHYAYLAAAGYLALRFMSEFAQGGWVA